MPSSTLVEKIYTYVCVPCERPGCTEIFIPTAEDIGNEKPYDAIDAWAIKAASKAEKLGWKIDEHHAVLCPIHGIMGIP